MKKLSLFLLTFAIIFLVTACSGAQGVAQKVVQLPDPIRLAILAGVTFVVGFLFTKLAEAIPWLANLLGQYVDEVSMAAGGALVLAVQNWLNAIPPEWEGVANAALALLVAILAAYGFLRATRKAVVAYAQHYSKTRGLKPPTG